MLPKTTNLRILTALGCALVVAVLVIHARLTAPDKSSVNGTYYNACCGDVAMRDGKLFYKKAVYSYDLENMKFGLTAYVDGKFTEEGIKPSPDKTAFLFIESGSRGFRTVVHGREYSFLRAK
jgi:hypothetical protein